jgi:hypothetical protein
LIAFTHKKYRVFGENLGKVLHGFGVSTGLTHREGKWLSGSQIQRFLTRLGIASLTRR